MNERIRQRLRELGMSNRQFAERMGYSKRTVECWLSGQNTPRLVDVVQICKVLECDPNWLLGWDGQKSIRGISIWKQ